MRTGKIDHPPKGCFVGETEIETISGYVCIDELTIKDKVLSFNQRTNNDEVVEIVAVKQTKITNELTELTFDNNKTIRCTPDHLFLLKNGQYVQAKDLTEEMELQD